MDEFSMRAAAALGGVKVSTIRHYEQIGLLAARTRSEPNPGLFSDKDVKRLRFIRHARELGFELDAIKTLLTLQDNPAQSCATTELIARARLIDVEQRLVRLTALKRELEATITSCGRGVVADCQVIEVLAASVSILGSEKATIPRSDLTDFEWGVIEPLLPTDWRGKERVDDRRVLNGILWRVRTGTSWADIPGRYGPYKTCVSRFYRWRKNGVWAGLLEAVSNAYGGELEMIDSSSIRGYQQARNKRPDPIAWVARAVACTTMMNRRRASEVQPGKMSSPSVEGAVRLLEGPWRIIILMNLFAGQVMRFSELQRAIPRMSPNRLVQQLSGLERDGLVSCVAQTQGRSNMQYTMTKAGRSLGPVFMALLEWTKSISIKEAGLIRPM